MKVPKVYTTKATVPPKNIFSETYVVDQNQLKLGLSSIAGCSENGGRSYHRRVGSSLIGFGIVPRVGSSCQICNMVRC